MYIHTYVQQQFQRSKQFNAAADARQQAAHNDNSNFIDEQRSRQHVRLVVVVFFPRLLMMVHPKRGLKPRPPSTNPSPSALFPQMMMKEQDQDAIVVNLTTRHPPFPHPSPPR